MKSAGKARSNGLYRHIRTSKEIIRNLLNDYHEKYLHYRLQQLFPYIFLTPLDSQFQNLLCLDLLNIFLNPLTVFS